MYIDGSVYPDLDNPPEQLVTFDEKADYLHRICGAWDHYIHAEPETFELFSTWKDAFDNYPLVTSPGYYAFRAWFGWEEKPVPPGVIFPEQLYKRLDRIEGRDEDPCEQMI